jgi:putative DNA primase/helicase
MKMAVHQFYEEDFQNKLNINGNLFGCKNGVLELRCPGADGRDHVVFRQGRPEDYVSFLAGQNLPETTAIDYIPYDAADPRQAELADFFSKLFPDKDVRRYALRLLASCLEGFNREQCFYIATGVGGNGKSKLVELMRLTFGDYQTSLQSTVLTRKRPESGAANPDIMAAKSRRFIYLQEPDDKEPLNTSRMKQFSGEDMVEARALYGETVHDVQQAAAGDDNGPRHLAAHSRAGVCVEIRAAGSP